MDALEVEEPAQPARFGTDPDAGVEYASGQEIAGLGWLEGGWELKPQ